MAAQGQTPICRNPFAKRCDDDIAKRRRRTESEFAGSVGLDGIQLSLLRIFFQVGVSDESNFLGSVQMGLTPNAYPRHG